MNLVDSHCHLYYEPYILDLKNTINECKKENVNTLLSIGVDYDTSKKNIEISNQFKEIYCTIGLHPNNVKNKKKEIEEIFLLLKESKKIVGIGECGLDLYRSKNNLSDQIDCFEKQINFSLENNLPFVIHARESDNEIIEVLNSFKNKNLKFILHCFSGSLNSAKKYIDLGGYISFSGILTFKKNDELRSISENLPIERILLETDSPYLSPHPFRGKVNHPKNVKFIAELLAKTRNVDLKEIASITTENFNKIFFK
jgi:TatD DNase family protein